MEPSVAGGGGSGQPLLADHRRSQSLLSRGTKSGAMPKYMARAVRETAQPPAFQREEGAMSTLVKALIGLAALVMIGLAAYLCW
jgi:hypothetical protein